jgi:4-diphosphocytidyl-2C-methyl-D-erythritol kinase
VYRAFDAVPAPESSSDHHVPHDFAGLVEWMRNDLWPAALHCAPELAQVAERLIDEVGAHATLLCGSGSAVAGLFPTRAEAAAAAARCPEAIAVVTPHTET